MITGGIGGRCRLCDDSAEAPEKKESDSWMRLEIDLYISLLISYNISLLNTLYEFDSQLK